MKQVSGRVPVARTALRNGALALAVLVLVLVLVHIERPIKRSDPGITASNRGSGLWDHRHSRHPGPHPLRGEWASWMEEKPGDNHGRRHHAAAAARASGLLHLGF
ncbi:hypothetical protein ACFZB9_18155 [Kitasatospora sp. NPDC008050]|uniref:hypothetical protein n=1 Tax=Kitasatospora sp. NPDC008050 TaxID=3364021 RepID=UPI0036E26712